MICAEHRSISDSDTGLIESHKSLAILGLTTIDRRLYSWQGHQCISIFILSFDAYPLVSYATQRYMGL